MRQHILRLLVLVLTAVAISGFAGATWTYTTMPGSSVIPSGSAPPKLLGINQGASDGTNTWVIVAGSISYSAANSNVPVYYLVKCSSTAVVATYGPYIPPNTVNYSGGLAYGSVTLTGVSDAGDLIGYGTELYTDAGGAETKTGALIWKNAGTATSPSYNAPYCLPNVSGNVTEGQAINSYGTLYRYACGTYFNSTGTAVGGWYVNTYGWSSNPTPGTVITTAVAAPTALTGCVTIDRTTGWIAGGNAKFQAGYTSYATIPNVHWVGTGLDYTPATMALRTDSSGNFYLGGNIYIGLGRNAACTSYQNDQMYVVSGTDNGKQAKYDIFGINDQGTAVGKFPYNTPADAGPYGFYINASGTAVILGYPDVGPWWATGAFAITDLYSAGAPRPILIAGMVTDGTNGYGCVFWQS